MAAESFLQFLWDVHESPAMLSRYNPRNLSQLLFHAKNEGYDFSAADISHVVGRLEVSVILNKDHDQIGGSSKLWREMWGLYHLEYIVRAVLNRHSKEEARSLIEQK
jgi:hypothetical protein